MSPRLRGAAVSIEYRRCSSIFVDLRRSGDELAGPGPVGEWGPCQRQVPIRKFRRDRRPRVFGLALPTLELPCWDDEPVVRSILVVDDDTAVRNLIVRILRSLGHVVVGEAGSVVDALALAQVLRPDTALVDIGLPDGDGFSLTRQLRARHHAIRVVLVSSDADPTNVAAAVRAGGAGFLPKDELSGPALQRLLRDEAEAADADD